MSDLPERITYIVGHAKKINARGTPLDASDIKIAMKQLRPWTETRVLRTMIFHLDLSPSPDVKVPNRKYRPVNIPTGELMEVILFFQEIGMAGSQTLVNDLYKATMTSKPDTTQPLVTQLRFWREQQVQKRPWMVIIEESQDLWRRVGL
ncbi:uncharacterized protein H6S33_007493 [Morchella sextelata]|uniref:uncharacterized protein n=1 Tax=Morchella sextelata TaxID=1174677 RepID=UPI001D0570E3|nr:uncharacterized protein H6S33_007493 [Morchella sextelata]KAH0603834.1 hypothetical protein H6S33_007493 [Morchella sextelata]